MGTFRPLIVFLLLSNSPSTSSFERPLLSTDISSNSKASFVNPEDQTPRAERSTARNTTTPIPIPPPELLRRFKREKNPKDPYNIRQDLKLKDDASLEEMINAMEERVCGNVCGSDFPTSSARWNQYDDCQACQCDSTCVRYNNCCPDVYLFRNITPSQSASECALMSPTSASVADYWNGENNLHHFASLITNCPTNGLISSDAEEMTQRLKCEKPNVLAIDEAVPVFDVTTKLSYTNVYCAMCNNVSSININQWDTELACMKPFKFDYRMSKTEIYQLLSTNVGVRESDCQITYVSDKQRWCRKPKLQTLKTCQANYKSTPQYNADIERACLRYTSVFMKIYNNVFCFMCSNIDTTVSKIENNVKNGLTYLSINRALLSFAGLIEFTNDDDDDDDDDDGDDDDDDDLGIDLSGRKHGSLSRSAQLFDNSTCSYKDIHCDQWRTYSPESNQCKGGLGGLGVAYQACLRVNVELETPPAFKTMKYFGQMLTSFEPTFGLKVAVSKWCPGDRTLVLHLESSAINEDLQGNSYAYEKTFNMDGLRLCGSLRVSKTFSDFSLKSCAFDIVSGNECLLKYTSSGRSIPCPVESNLQVGTSVFWNIPSEDENGGFMGGFGSNPAKPKVKNIEDKYTFRPYKRTDHCPFVEVSDEEFDEIEKTIIHHTSLKSIDIWKTHVTSNISVRICEKDYQEWSKSEGSKCSRYDNRRNGSDDSFDSLTIAGLISIASLVSLCLSNF